MVATTQPARLLDDGFLKYLPRALREPRRAWLVLSLSLVLTFAGAAIVASLLAAILPSLGQPDFSQFFGKGLLTVFALAIATPLIETLIMAAVLELMLRLRVPAGAAVLLSALGWGAAHSSQAAGWGLVIWWPFLIFSTLYVTWSKRGIWTGVAIVFAVHALQNLGPALLLLRS